MRWPFGRRSTPTDRATATGTGPGTASAAARPHDAWRSLPAVQRTIGRPPVVAPAAPFAERLATRQSPDLALAPLGHEVSPLASPGVLIGLVTTTDAANTGRLDLPVQRHAADGHPAEAEPRGWSQFDDDTDVLFAGGAGAGLESVIPRAAAGGPAGPGGIAAPAPITASVQRLAAPAPILTGSGSTTVAPPPAGTFDLRPGPAPASVPAVLPAGLPAVPVAQRTGAGPVPALPSASEPAPAVRRPTLGQARRLGLGAPLPVGPDGSVQRLAAVTPADHPALGPVGDPGRDAGNAGGGPASPLLTAPEPAGTATGSRATEPAADPGWAAISGPTQLTVVRPLSIQRLAGRLSPTTTAERTSQPGGQAPDAAPAPGATGELAIQRLPLEAQSSSPAQPQAGLDAGPATDPLFGPDPTAGSVTGPVGRLPIRASAAGSLLDPRLPASPASGVRVPIRLPGADPQPVVARSVGEPLRSSPAVAASAAPIAGRSNSAQREPVGPVVPRSPSASSLPADALGGPSPAGSAGAPSVQRAVEVRELVITTQVDNRGPAGEPAGGATPASATTPAAAGAPPSIADRDRELDELARRLYGRIRTKLAAELLADRERAGLLVDLR